ncbi:MAG: aspartate kinase [Pseudomonadales bacterium]|jgi:aspartate kinase
MTVRTVEKIGGTTMSRFPELMDSLFVDQEGNPDYGRIFVVSAYGGMTDLLLEHKHSGEPGVFSLFSEGDDADEWQDRLSDVGRRMCAINHEFFSASSPLRRQADEFVGERVADARQCLSDVQRVCSFGPFDLDAYLDRVRELLSSMGEAHSAHNASMLLAERGVKARFVDLTGWRDSRSLSLDGRIVLGLQDVDVTQELPIVTGYAQCEEGLVKRYARGYTEITMSRIAVLTKPEEAVIHKEYHLSSADPKIVGAANSVPIGRTNYDVADQLANLGMEAIHPSAANMLRKQNIPLRVKHAFQPHHSGTLIDSSYRSSRPKVEIIAGRRGIMAIEVFDQDMIGQQTVFETRFIEALKRFKVKSVGKDLNANSITHYVTCPLRTARRLIDYLEEVFPGAELSSRKVAFVCAIGTDMDMPGILARCASALGDAGVPILSVSQPLRGVDARFVVEDEQYAVAVKGLHDSIIGESKSVGRAA